MKQGNWGHFGVAMDAFKRLLNRLAPPVRQWRILQQGPRPM